MVRCMMILIMAAGRNMKWMMTFNLCLIPLNKILGINYTYCYTNQSMVKKILWRVTIFIYLSDNGLERGVIHSKRKTTIRKTTCKVKEDVCFGELCNK